MSQLKPCPFCGGTKLTRFVDITVCDTCDAEGPVRDGIEPDADWNTRDTADLRAAQIRALEWCCDCADRAELDRRIAELKNAGELI